ncbi:DUF222 domain-containing protein [Flexivirga sp. B27]
MAADDDAVIGQLTACVRALEDLPDMIDRLAPTDLAQLMSVLLRLRSRSEQLGTLVARQASERGDVRASDAANTTQWVGNCATEAGVPLDMRDAHTMGSVADACNGDTQRPVTDALLAGTCTPAVARTALTEFAKIEPIIPESSREKALGWYLALDPATGRRGQERLTRQILADNAEDELDKRDETLERTESLSWRTTATGMTRLTAELAPVNAAIVTEALLALSAPRGRTVPSANTTGPNTTHPSNSDPLTSGAVDDRTPTKRRVDALVALVSRGARSPDAVGDVDQVGAAARVVVTVPLRTLKSGCGAAISATGEVLDTAAARRLACDADVVPVVLGTASEPLDVGRTKRLVTKGIRTAVTLRDRGCTFPGCDRPPTFCEIHHIVPWSSGGVTSLLNSAMLCTTHHQTVHRYSYSATATAVGVRWDLTRGRMTKRRPDAA